jgi:hypothetical protein
MRNRENILAALLGGTMILAVGGFFFATHYQALLHPSAGRQNLAGKANAANGLNIPTIDEMCRAAGATSANMASCQSEENQAAEFVIAWMGLNGFITDGAIDIGQIQLAAELGTDAASPLSNPDPSLFDPSLGGDPSLADPSLADPSLADPSLAEPNIDPQTGLPVDQSFDTPAGIAMYCLSSSMDWLQMHDCISRYDPSTRFTGQ